MISVGTLNCKEESMPAPNYTNIGLQFPFPCQCPLLGHAFYESASLKNTFPERDLLCASLEECRGVAAVAEVEAP